MLRRNTAITTICWDGKTLATDSKSTMSGMALLGNCQKIYHPAENEYWSVQGVKVIALAIAGKIADLPFAIEALNEGLTHRTDIDWFSLDFLCILIDETGQAWYWGMARDPQQKGELITLVPITGPITGGSGSRIAAAVLSIGADAKTAVEAAIRLDNGSGGEVVTWEFPGAPAVPSVRPHVDKPPAMPATMDEFHAAVNHAVVKAVNHVFKLAEEPVESAPVVPPATHPLAPVPVNPEVSENKTVTILDKGVF